MMKNRRVVVTGMGVIAANGTGLSAFGRALREGKSGIRFCEKLAELNFACQVGGVPQGVEELKKSYLTDDNLFAMNEGMVYASIAAIDAFRDAGLKIPAADEDFVYEDTGAIIGTGIGGLDTVIEKLVPAVSAGKVRRLGSSIVEQVMASSNAAKLGGLLALGNQVTANSSACSTGTEALIMGFERIRAGLADRMVVGSTEGTHPYIWSGFDAMKVLSKGFNDRPEQASRPMSTSSAGFVPGGGAGCLVLEDLEVARARGAKIYAEVKGASLTCGGMRFGGSMTAPSPKGVVRAIRQAVLEAGIKPSEIDYINGHLTATFADPYEVKNWSEALERVGKDFPLINSTKSMIGHGLGAAGSIECVATVLQLYEGFVHPSINCEDLNPEIEKLAGLKVVREAREENLNVVAKASFGFGDVNSCVIFGKLGDL